MNPVRTPLSSWLEDLIEIGTDALSPEKEADKIWAKEQIAMWSTAAGVAFIAGGIILLLGLTARTFLERLSLLTLGSGVIYTSFNANAVLYNAEDIATHPVQYYFLARKAWNHEKINAQLLQNTFHVEWAVKWLTKKYLIPGQ